MPNPTVVNKQPQKLAKTLSLPTRRLVFSIMILGVLLMGCGTKLTKVEIEGLDRPVARDTILAAATRQSIGFDALIDELANVRVVYVGENHPNMHHHHIQLRIIQALAARNPALMVGMEMFDYTYQPILDDWSSGRLDTEQFIEKTHWYANWRYNFELYQPILEYLKTADLRLVGLNVPFYLPARIATGGLTNLAETDKQHLPSQIDLTHPAHRAYVRTIFDRHRIRGRRKFEYFYAAQCVWDEAMAGQIHRHLQDGQMVVLAGNGHIIEKFGIPDRAHRRNQQTFKTVYLSPVKAEVKLSFGDFIWIAP